MKTIVLIIFSLFLSSCCSGTVYIVQRDVPENPSFTVVPNNYSQEEINFATFVEELLISAGVKTFDYNEPEKEIEVQKQAGQVQVNADSANKTKDPNVEIKGADLTTKKTERFRVTYINSDYIIRTSYSTNRVKIIKTSSMEVITSFQFTSLSSLDFSASRELFTNSLKNMGVKIIEIPVVKGSGNSSPE